jgi:prepilin peptidase CpaA
LALAVLLLPYAFGMLGAGDVKFAAAIGAWLGAPQLFVILVVGGLVTGVFSLLLIAWRTGARGLLLDFKLLGMRLMMVAQGLYREDQLETVQSAVQRPDRRHRLIPFSAMMALAVIMTLVYRYVAAVSG